MGGGKYWTASYNPVLGCSVAAPTCHDCWAENVIARMEAAGHVVADGPLVHPGGGWTGHIGRTKRPPRLTVKGRAESIAVNWLGDLFRERTPEEMVFHVLDDIVANALQRGGNPSGPHQMLFLTHRPLVMLRRVLLWMQDPRRRESIKYVGVADSLWWGVTVTRQSMLDDARAVAALPGRHWLSVEPIEERVTLWPDKSAPLVWDWVTVGTSTTSPIMQERDHVDAVDDMVVQCMDVGVPVWVKQRGRPALEPRSKFVRQMPQAIAQTHMWPI